MPKQKTPTQIHEGHRARLLDNIAANGLENLGEVQQLEYLLSLAIPRKDTNPTAHALLSQFGSLANVLDADPKILANTKTVGLRTAKILSSFRSIHTCYQKSKLNKKTRFTSNAVLNEFCRNFLQTKQYEELYLFCLDIKQQLIGVDCIKKGDVNSIKFTMNDINEVIVRNNAKAVFLAHSHPNLSAHPSNADVITTRQIVQFLDILGIPLLDHVIVAGDQAFSFFQNNLLQKSINSHSGNNLFNTVVSVASPNSETEVLWE